MLNRSSYRTILLAAFVLGSPAGLRAEPQQTVDFARDVYPIFRRSCFDCHGPEKQEADLRLDERQAALDSAFTSGMIVPGDVENSELLRRVTLPADDAEIMPAVGGRLSKREIDTLRRWIAEGANWPEDFEVPPHWSYVKPARPTLPAVSNNDWPQGAIDHFVLRRLEQQGLEPSPAADRATLIRRLSLDLIGLPPSPEEVDAFVGNESADAYERLVDELLSRPQFGQRWARPWLDLARYADSHGFQRDNFRDIWAYRDWVIDALNADMPFDQFTIEQIAGDLLPEATVAQRIATGFHRCAPTNVEAGSLPEETRIEQVIDRVNTTGAVWLGTTLECCQCHDHKYDPFTQRDYYRLLAYYNNTEQEADRADPKVPSSIAFMGPTMDLPDPERDAERATLEAKLADVKQRTATRRDEIASDLETWIARLSEQAANAPRTHTLAVTDFQSTGVTDTHEILDDGSVLLLGDDPPSRDTYEITLETDVTGIRAIKLEALTDDSLPGKGPGRGDPARPNFVLRSFAVTAQAKGDTEAPTTVEFIDATASFSQANWDVKGAIDDNPKTGWAIAPKFGQSHWAVFESREELGFEGGTQFTATVVQNHGGARAIGRLRISAVVGDPNMDQIPADVTKLLTKDVDSWSDEDRKQFVDYCVSLDKPSRQRRRHVQQLQKQIGQLAPDTTLVMRELDEPRPTHIFDRGDYRNPGEAVEPGTPEVLHALDEGPANRLLLARWLVSRENPLVARVTVNRLWAELFGRGIVTTVEDFGIKGEPPTHPELLDWLAVEFMDSGWSIKHVIKTIVRSATYRQSSRVTPELLARDDQNRLYARGPRYRMDAEMIRDNALSIAGLLSLEHGGPPIRPYQPEGVWSKVGGTNYEYVVSPGDARYRRGIYIVLKRGAPYPSLVNFDATARLACTVKRSRTNTPLQALTLLNDEVYVEAAKGLARRVLTERPDADVDERIAYAFRLCTARRPTDSELGTLRGLFERQRDANDDGEAAKQLVGDFSLPDDVQPEEFAAWYAVATTLLNLHETITKS